MTISGPEMHRILIQGFKSIQSRLDSIRGRVTQFDDQRGELGDDRSEALLDLAKHYLPDLTPDSINATWVEVRSSLSRVLMRQQEERKRCAAEAERQNDRRSLEEDRLLEVNALLDRAVDQREDLLDEVERRLSNDEAFAKLSEQAAAAEAALERAEANLNEIEQDAARKLPAYEESSLFKYLRDRNYGTELYTQRGFTRRMDRWLAKYIDYAKAKKGYEFLINTPDQMRTIIAEDRESLDTVMEELEKRHDEVVKTVGLDDAVAEVERLTKERQKQLDDLDEIREEADKLEQQLTDLESSRGKYYQEAVDVFRSMLASIDTRELNSRARDTPEITDDQIVARIQGIDTDLDRLDDEHRRQRQEVRQLQQCIEAYGRVMQRFRAAKFDAARSQFLPSVDVLGQIDRAKDENDIEELWQSLRHAQRWGPTLGQQVEQVANHPLTHVLIGAMAQAAGAMNEHARRAGRRRYQNRRNRNADWSGDSSVDYRRR